MFEREITRTKFLSRPSYEHHYSFQRLNLCEMQNLVHFKTLDFSLVTAQWQADNSYFSPPSSTGIQKTSNLHLQSGEAKSQLALEASSIKRDIWFATIIGYLGKEGFR